MSRWHPLRDAGLAVSLLTIVPTRARMPEDGSVPQAAGWFPAVGLALGLLGYSVAKIIWYAHWQRESSILVAAVVVALWAVMTRMLHYDGLADVADGFWGSHDRARRLEIMSDSHIGSFGATGIALVVVLEVAAIGAIIGVPDALPLLIVPAFARFSATAGCWLGTPARPHGLGRSVMGRPTAAGVLPAAAVAVALAAALWTGYGVAGLVILALGGAAALAIPHVLSSRFGGVTGDVLGASVLITEALLFAALAQVVVIR